MVKRTVLASTIVITAGVLRAGSLTGGTQDGSQPAAKRVYASFDLSHPQGGPFPSDIFSVDDPTQLTGRRLNYPLPDCGTRPTDCADLAMVNTLDGWGLQPRVSIPFTGDVDPSTLNSDTVFLLDVPQGRRIGINQRVWDPAAHTLHAESDEVLDQHHRYAVVVTDQVRDTSGKAVKAISTFTFEDSDYVPAWYQARLEEVLDAARRQGLMKSDIVAASAFTTQTVTSVMERIRDSIKASTPPAADFRLGPSGEPTVFPRDQVSSATWMRQTRVNPPLLVAQALPLAALNVVAGAVGTIAYGRYSSPDYLVHPGEYIPAVGTLTDMPPIGTMNTIYFTLYLPAGEKPPGGWPMAILSGGSSTNKHFSSTIFAAKLAQHGIATIGINHVGQGFGPETKLQINRIDGTSLTSPDAGRSVDQNGDNVIGATEGSRAAGWRSWTIAERDAFRQTIVDFLQLVRVIEVGVDVDGNGDVDINPSRIYFVGASQGSMLATIFLALEPNVHAGVAAFPPGVSPEHLRWHIVRRPEIGAALGLRVPSLLNDAVGLTSIDGVPVAAPFFNENKPLRDQPIVINDVPGALEIQEALEFSEMVSQAGLSPALWSRYLRQAPLPGSSSKSVIYLFAQGDRTCVNPGTTLLLRAGNLADRTIYFRTDLAVAQDPTFPREPHAFLINTSSANLLGTVALNGQESIAAFLESDGTVMYQPLPNDLFEMPIRGPLPETLNFIR
jgi:Big-like domain-containing protein